MVDEVLGRPPVVRCRVCHNPSGTGVHPECQKRQFTCTGFPDHPGELPPLVRPPPPKPHDTALGQTIARNHQSMYVHNLLLAPVRCPQCGGAGTMTVTDCPECRPGSSRSPGGARADCVRGRALAQGGISHRGQKTRMGRAKEQYLLWLEAQARLEDASYEEAQSRLRMSTLCKDCVRQLSYPLPARIVELAISDQADDASPRATSDSSHGPQPEPPLPAWRSRVIRVAVQRARREG